MLDCCIRCQYQVINIIGQWWITGIMGLFCGFWQQGVGITSVLGFVSGGKVHDNEQPS